MSKITEIEKRLDDLLSEAPMDFIGTGDTRSGMAEQRDFERKVKEFKMYLREQLKPEVEPIICTRYHLGD